MTVPMCFQPQLSFDYQLGHVGCIKEDETDHIFTFHLRIYKARVWCGGRGGEFGIEGLFQRWGQDMWNVLSEQPGGILIGLQWQLLWQTWGNIQGISRGKRTLNFHTTPWLGYCTKGRYSNNSIRSISYIFYNL